MITLSTKVPSALADAFSQWCEDQGETPSAALRAFVTSAVKCRRLEVQDPEIGPPIGWLYLVEEEQPGPILAAFGDDRQARSTMPGARTTPRASSQHLFTALMFSGGLAGLSGDLDTAGRLESSPAARPCACRGWVG